MKEDGNAAKRDKRMKVFSQARRRMKEGRRERKSQVCGRRRA